MSTMDPTGDGGGGGTSTSIEDNVTPGTPSTDIVVPPGSQHQHHPPPSPLSGCYLLVVLPEPHTAQHRDLILNRLAKGFLSWDKDSCHVDLEKELQALVAQAPEGEEARNGERLIQYATENLVTEVLIHPQTNTLLQCMRNLLASFTKHRHIIHAGYTFGGNGSWILQDGTFSLADFLDAFSEHEVQRVLRAYENSVTVDINCAGVGEWSTSRLSKEACTRSCRVRLNPDDVLTAGVAAITSFTNYVGQYLLPQTLDQLMEPSDVVGNIRFSHPTLYVFPGGQGDAALFGINGFNMLVDGGFARKACFWDFARHLDRLDAVLVTRVNNSNVGGMSSVLRKKREMHVYPQIGHFFCNLVERRHSNSPDGDKDLDPLTLNLIDIGQEMMVDLRQINLRAHPCYRDPNPINLYHKVGHGTLDMYVLSPSKDSREVREFLSKWHSADSKLFAGSHKKDSNNLSFPIQNLASICALLVWQPANPEDTITRILFPGSTPQHKIFEGFERLKHLEFLKHPVCTAKNLSPSTSLLTLKDRPTIKQKLGLIEKESKKSFESKREKRDFPESKLSKAAAEEIVPKPTPQTTPSMPTPKAQPQKIDVKTKKVVENKKIETDSKKIEKDLKEMKKESVKRDIARTDKDVETKKTEVSRTKSDGERTVPSKEPKVKAEPKKKDAKDPKIGKISKIEMPPKPAAKLADKKPKPVAEKKDSTKASPPTPKKTMNGSATKAEVASKTMPRPITKPAGKQPLSSMPAKSAKDANNRKVVEQKNIEIASAASAAAPASAKLAAKPKTSERKPISRRPKPVSPSKARVPGSPAKSTRSTPTTSVKSDKDGVIRKVKGDRGTTDSSTVSTPSGIEIDSMTKLADKSLTEKSEDMSLDSIESKVLADLKEEREVVEEIEAVLQKAERIEEARKDDHLDGDDDITAEATDKKEDDMTEDDVTADIEEAPKKKSSRKPSQELTEEDEYLIVEKEEIYIEDSAQSGEGEQKHVLDAVESEKVKPVSDVDVAKEEEEEEAEVSEEKEKSDVPEKKLLYYDEETTEKEKEADEMSPGHKEQLKEEMKDIIASATEIVQKAEDKDDSGKKDSEDITKEPSSLSPDKFDSSEKKTTDTDPMKPEVDQQKDQQVAEKMEESQERISTLESGATTTAPTLPEDERIPLDDIKEVIDEKYVAEEDKEKDTVEQVKESFVASVPVEPKPDAKLFQVRPALQGIQREIVKTPDEVADLPVHEEVDPKLYRMEDFEKAKEDKPSVAPASHQPEAKEPPTPPVKEQKGVFSFFGKVADKFEKGMDKLTGKSRRDSEKDIDEKSSSKSSSPKEPKIQELAFPSDVQREEINEALAKAVKQPELSETFEKGEPEVSKIKVAAITDTAAFLQREIEDLTKSTLPEEATKGTVEAADTDKPKSPAASKPVVLSEPVFETCVLKGQQKDLLSGPIADVEDDVEDVEALLEEASKKFKTVKDSLRDSLESLEDKMVEEEMVRAELAAAAKDVVKDTLSEVVEKLEEIKPHIEESTTLDDKEPEKVKFEIPKSEDLEVEEDLTEVTKDFKEAVRDVGEVLAGSAGILIEEKPKDVVEIVKKVAEVLKKDDFLSHDVLFDKDTGKPDDKVSDSQSTPVKPVVEEMIPKKVGVTEELPPQEEIEEMLESGLTTKPLESYKPPVDSEVEEEPCVKTIASKGAEVTSPMRDLAADKIDAMKICADLMEEDTAPSRRKRSILDEDLSKPDVMEAGIESVCVKQEVKHQTSKEDEPREIEGSDIVFDRKLSPDKAQIVMVTPDSAPTSPQFPGAKMHAKGEIDEVSQLPSDIQKELDKEGPLEKIIEDLVFTKKTKITIEIVEYITVVRKIPREKVIYIIEEIIIKKGVPRDSVVADLDLLKPDIASSEKRAEIEDYIDREYITKNKKITIDIVEEISIKKFVTKRIVIEIIEEIIVKKKIPRNAVLDISESELARLRGHGQEPVSDEVAEPEASQVIEEEVDAIPETEETSEDVRSEIEKYILDDIISKGVKVTPHFIDDISIAKRIPRRVFIEILEEVIVRRKLPRSTILDISEKELSEIIASEKEDVEEDEAISEIEKEDESDHDSLTSETRQQIEKNIIDEYITKNRRITPYIFEEMCVQNKVSRRRIILIIEELIVKHKVPRSSVLDISEIELEELLAVDKDEDDKESIAAASEDEDEKHSGSEIEEYEAVTTEKLSEIENTIIDEFISKSKRITPYIFEDICVRYKIPRRILIELIEEIIIKRKIRRGSILDITDVELSELLVAVEAEGEEDEPEVRPTAEPYISEDAGEDKLVDGFVSIPAKVVAPTAAVSPSKTVELAEPALKESEKDVTDDFEAVEQEYKIHDTQITTTKEPVSKVPAAQVDNEKLGDGMEEAIDEDVSDVIEADEKSVGAVAPITIPTPITEKKTGDVSESPEIVDATEKYLSEAHEKPESQKHSPVKPSDTLVDDVSQAKLPQEQKTEVETTPQQDTTGRKDSVASEHHEEDVPEKAMPTQEKPTTVESTEKTEKPTDTGVVAETAKPSEGELKEPKEPSESKEQEPKDKSPVAEDKTDTMRVKRSIGDESQQLKDDMLPLQEHVEAISISEKESPEDKKIPHESPIDDKSEVPSSTIHRLSVTATSDDGKQEKEVSPVGSITLTTKATPDDSLKSSPVKTSSDHDSLHLDKESLRTGASTPEKDSISGKSTPGTKDGDKVTPEDSLIKSPPETHDSQDLEDSLKKLDSTKSKLAEKPLSPTKMEPEVMLPSKIGSDKSDESIQSIVHEKEPISDEKSLTSETADTVEKVAAQETTDPLKYSPVKPTDHLLDDIKLGELQPEKVVEAKAPEDTTVRKDSVALHDLEKDDGETETLSQKESTPEEAKEKKEQLPTTAAGVDKAESKPEESEEEPKKIKEPELEDKSPVTDDKIDTTRVKRSIDDSQERKASLTIEEHSKAVSPSETESPEKSKTMDAITDDVETAAPISTVHRMLVTASSEDGGQEKEVCATEGIDFTTSKTPDDSVKTSPVTSIPEKDSLPLDKESIRTGASTPEKDSMSGKSTPGTTDGGKVTPEESLAKSPVGSRASQELEGSVSATLTPGAKDVEKITPEDDSVALPSKGEVPQDLEDSVSVKSEPETKDGDKMTPEESLVKSPSGSQVSHDSEVSVSDKSKPATKDGDKITPEESLVKSPSGSHVSHDSEVSITDRSAPETKDVDKETDEDSAHKTPSETQETHDLEVRDLGELTPEPKDDGKIISEDKSPLETRDSRDLEDSLAKSAPTKEEKAEKPELSAKIEPEVTPAKLDVAAERSDETAEATIHEKEAPLHKVSDDLAATPKTTDTTEEIEDHADTQKHTPVKSGDHLGDDVHEVKPTHEQDIDDKFTPKEDTTDRKDSVAFADHEKEVIEKDVSSKEETKPVHATDKIDQLQTDHALEAKVTKPSAPELEEEPKKSPEQEDEGKSPIIEDLDTTRVKRSIDDASLHRKDSLPIQEHTQVKAPSKTESPEVEKVSDEITKDDETAIPTSTVHRMSITATSDDGKQEKELHPTESITFTATKTPDDTLESSSVKTVSDKDSLHLDKESLHTGASTPEKDSVSGKSTPGTKDSDKVTPEDSLVKSLSEIRDSQAFEDSLVKSDPAKVEAEKRKSLTEPEKEVKPSEIETVKAVSHEKESDLHQILDDKSPISKTVEATKEILSQEKAEVEKHIPVEPQADSKQGKDTEAKTTPEEDTSGRKDSIAFEDHHKEIHGIGISPQEEPVAVQETKKAEPLPTAAIGKEISEPFTGEPAEVSKESAKPLEGKSPVVEDKTDISQRKDSLSTEKHTDTISTSGIESPEKEKVTDDIPEDHEKTPLTVHMVVTASSEDDEQEKGVSPRKSIDLTATKTPDDSLRSSPIKTTPEQDSLLLEKELRTGASTPDKDSVSGKSTPGTKDGDRITPEDSLDKSPLGARDSPDLEDSLAKSDSTKVEKDEKPKSSTEIEHEVKLSKSDIVTEKSDETTKGIIQEKESHPQITLDEKIPSSDSVEAPEKSSIAAPEEDHSEKITPLKPSDDLADVIDEAKLKQEKYIETKVSPQTDATGRKGSVVVQDDQKEIGEGKIASHEDETAVQESKKPVQLETSHETVAEISKPDAVKSEEKPRESKEQESRERSPVAEDKVDITHVKPSTDDVLQQRKDSLSIQEHAEVTSPSKTESSEIRKMSVEITKDDQTTIPISTVHRMSVTASSDDAKPEKELHLTESASFTATKTPDDSLKSSPIKTTPEKDSLLLDHDSVRTGASTPEKDSVSGKSTPGTKDGDKVTPEDSLDKSPLASRTSQDFEDSLAKSGSIKVEKEEKPTTSPLIEPEAMLPKSGVTEESTDSIVKEIAHEKESHLQDTLEDTTEKYLIEAQEKTQSQVPKAEHDTDVTTAPQEDTTGQKDLPASQEHEKEIPEHKSPSKEDVITVQTEKPVLLQTDGKPGTDGGKSTTEEIEKARKDSKDQDSEGKSPATEDDIDHTRGKRSIDEGSQRKDSLPIEEHAETLAASKESLEIRKMSDEITKDDETAIPTSTVHRMSVTASSEDGQHEKELHLTESITLTATKTPDDSLKSSPVKSTSDKESLLLDKESLHTGASTPEKDSVSDKSSPGAKVVDTTMPEDSSIKSRSGSKASQDLKDSLDTLDVTKVKEAEKATSPTKKEEVALPTKLDVTADTDDEAVKTIDEKESHPHEALDDKPIVGRIVTTEEIEAEEKVQALKSMSPTDKHVDDTHKDMVHDEEDTQARTKPEGDTAERKDSVASHDQEKEVGKGTITLQEEVSAPQAIDKAEHSQLDEISTEKDKHSAVESEKEGKDSKEQESDVKSPKPEEEVDITRAKRSIDESIPQRKDSLSIHEHVEPVSTSGASSPGEKKILGEPKDDEKTAAPTTAVQQMSETEDDGQDKKISLTGSVTSTTTITPEDSFKTSPVKTAPEHDSLTLDKESLRTGASTPERDSISGKSTPGTKSGDKTTPDDGLDKSALETRVSQVLEDSLAKTDSSELKETVESKSVDKIEKATTPSKLDDAVTETEHHDTPKDRSRSHSVFDAGEKTPAGRSRTASLFEDSVPEALSLRSEFKIASDVASGIHSYQESDELKPTSDDLSRKSSVKDVIEDLSRKSSVKDVIEDISKELGVKDFTEDLSRKSSVKDIEEDLSRKASVKDVTEDVSRASSVKDATEDLSRKSSVKDVMDDVSRASSVKDAMEDLSSKSSVKDVMEDLSSKASVKDAMDDLSRKSSVKDSVDDLSRKSSVKDVMEDVSKASSVKDAMEDLSRKSSVKDVMEDLPSKTSVKDAMDDLSRKSSVKDATEDVSRASSVKDAMEDLSRKSSVKDVIEDLSSKASVKDVMEDPSRKASSQDVMEDISRASSVKDAMEDVSRASSVKDAMEDVSRASSVKDAMEDVSRKSSVKDVMEDLSGKASVKDAIEDLSRKSSVKDVMEDLSSKASVKDVTEDVSRKSSVKDAMEDLSRKSSVKDVMEDLTSKASVKDAMEDLSRKSSVKDVMEDLSSKASVKDAMEDLSRKSSVKDVMEDLSSKASVKDVTEDVSRASSVKDAMEDVSRKSSVKDAMEDLSSKSSVKDATDDLSRKSSVKDAMEDLSSKSSVKDATDDLSRKSSVKEGVEDVSRASSVKDAMEDLSRKSSVKDVMEDVSRKSSVKDAIEDLSSKSSVKDVMEDVSKKEGAKDVMEDLSRKSSVKDVMEDVSRASSVKDVMEDVSRASSVKDVMEDVSRASSVKDVMEDVSTKESAKDVIEDLSRKSSVQDVMEELSRKSSVKDVMEDLSSKSSVKDGMEDLSRKSSVKDVMEDLSRKSSVKDAKEDLSSKSSVKDVTEDLSSKVTVQDATDDLSRKSSVKDVVEDKKDSVSSDSRKSSLAKFEDATSKRSSVAIQEDIAGQFAEDYHTTTDEISKVEEYIVNRYIIKKEKITSRVVEEIVMLYSMPKYMILELIEAIIMKKNVPRDFVVDYPKFEETCDSAVTTEDDHVDVIDISPAKRQDIESYIQEEFITKRRKISSKAIDDLATRNSVSRYIIIMVIEEIITKRKIQRAELLEDGAFEESSKHSHTSSYGPMEHEDRLFDEENLPSISTEYHISSRPSISSSDIRMEQQSGMSEQKRVQVETYVMEECVKKGKKITVLVLEQIMAKMSISRSDLLDIIENIIITRKMSRKTMVDDAIYDEVDVGTSKSPEIFSTKDRFIEFSGKSTPDPKSSGYSTPESRQYDDKLSREMSSYSTDYESPFHKAFVGGMTEIRTTHITTLSGKSTPDFGARGETPESLSDSIASSSQTKAEEKVPSDKDTHTSANEFNDAVEQAPSISTVGVAMTTTSTTASSALGSVPELKDYGTSVTSGKVAGEQAFSDDRMKHDTINIDSKSHLGDMPEMTKIGLVEHDHQTTATTKVIETEVISEEEPEVITRVIRREVIEDEEPEVTTRVIRREVIEDEEPEVTTRVIRREVIEDEEPEIITRVIRREVIEDEEEPEVITRVIRREVIDDEEPEVITRVIRREVIGDEKPDVIRRVIRREVIGDGDEGEEEEQETEVITRVIRREIIDQDDDIDDGTQQFTISRRISNQDGTPDTFETITTRTTKTIVTDDTPGKVSSEQGPTYVTRVTTQDSSAGGPISADIKRTITTVTTVTDPDGKVTTKKDVQETTDTLEGDELLEKLIDSTKTDDNDTVTDAKSIESLKTEKIITETIKTVSPSSASGIRGDFDAGKSTPDSVLRDEKYDSLSKSKLEKVGTETVDHAKSPAIKDIISDERSYSGKSSPDMSLPKDIHLSSSTGKSTPDIPHSPFTRDGGGGTLVHTSGRSTPDKRADSRSSTATPEGFRSSEVIRTTITTTRTMSEEGDIITTTKEITEATNEKGEVTILTEKTDVKVEDRVLPKDIGESSPKSDHSSMHSRAGTHAWGGSEDRHTYSDDEVPGSPLSTTSQVGYSPQSTYHFGEQSFGKDSSHKSIEFSEADMSSSFYGELPDLPPRVTTLKAAYLDSGASETSGTSGQEASEGDFSFKKFTVEKEFAGGFSEKSGGRRYVDDADLDFEKALMERKEMKRDRGDTSSTAVTGYTNGNVAKPSSSSSEEPKDPKDDTKRDPLEGWGTPLGLPSPKPPRKFNLRTTARPTNSADISPDSLNFDAINDWGEPLRLPSPAPVADEASNKGTPVTPKKERKQPKKVLSENIKNRKRSESPSKNEKKTKDAKNKVQPVYMDLTYVPHHGNSYYTSLEFFKRIRARYYVFSGTEPSREVYDALLDAKKTWEDKDLEVTMIPTYDTDTLGYWVADNEEALAANHIDLSPSASRCTINLQDHETSCSAYRLEF